MISSKVDPEMGQGGVTTTTNAKERNTTEPVHIPEEKKLELKFFETMRAAFLRNPISLTLITIFGIAHQVALYQAVQWICAFVRVVYLEPIGYQSLTMFTLNFSSWMILSGVLLYAWKGGLSIVQMSTLSGIADDREKARFEALYHRAWSMGLSSLSFVAGLGAVQYYGGTMVFLLFLVSSIICLAMLFVDRVWIHDVELREYVRLFILALGVHCLPVYLMYAASARGESSAISANDLVYTVAYVIYSSVHAYFAYSAFARMQAHQLTTRSHCAKARTLGGSRCLFFASIVAAALLLGIQVLLLYVSSGESNLWECADERVLCRTMLPRVDGVFSYVVPQKFDDSGVCVFETPVDELLERCADDYLIMISDTENDDDDNAVLENDDDFGEEDSDVYGSADAEAELYSNIFASPESQNYPEEIAVSVEYDTWTKRKKRDTTTFAVIWNEFGLNRTSPSCSNTCMYASDGECDDGGVGAHYALCQLGTDCNDCGSRSYDDSDDGEGRRRLATQDSTYDVERPSRRSHMKQKSTKRRLDQFFESSSDGMRGALATLSSSANMGVRQNAAERRHRRRLSSSNDIGSGGSNGDHDEIWDARERSSTTGGVEYKVSLEVSARRHSGTSDEILIKLYGSNSHAHISTPWFPLNTNADLSGSTTRVQTQTFSSAPIGALSHVVIRSNGKDGLRLSSLTVNVPSAYQTSRPAQSLYISGYLEGRSGYDKAIAITNPNCYPVRLDADKYELWISKNGASDWPPRASWRARIFGIIEPLGTMLFSHPRASNELYHASAGSLHPLTSQNRLKSVLGYNGDDVIALVASGSPVDTIGSLSTRGPWPVSNDRTTRDSCLLRRDDASGGTWNPAEWTASVGNTEACLTELLDRNIDESVCRAGAEEDASIFSTKAVIRCRGSKRKRTWNCDSTLEPLAPSTAPDAASACPPCDKAAQGAAPTVASTFSFDSSNVRELTYSFGSVWVDCEVGGGVRFKYSAHCDDGCFDRHGSFRRSPSSFFPGGDDTYDGGVSCQQTTGRAYPRTCVEPLRQGRAWILATAQDRNSCTKEASYDRGHLVPANHLDHDQDMIKQSNYMTNILPQHAKMNRGAWLATEMLVECLRDVEPVTVLGGAVYADGPSARVFEETHGVLTPSHFWKIIVARAGGRVSSEHGSGARVIAFWMENDERAKASRVGEYIVSLSDLESLLSIHGQPEIFDEFAAQEKATASPMWTVPASCNRG